MNLERFFHIQKALDETIRKEKGLDRPERIQTIVALLVEIGELANETRTFKYWSNKPASSKSVILEEYADCMHFLLSIGIEHGYVEAMKSYRFLVEDRYNLTEEIYYFSRSVVYFAETSNFSAYLDIWDHLLQVGVILGYTNADIQNAYLTKNKKNLERQANGY